MNITELNAIGLIELSSIALGIRTADEMLKRADVQVIVHRTVCPGKYMIIVGGQVAAVQASIEGGKEVAGSSGIDSFLIPNVHHEIFPALSGTAALPKLESLGIIETFSVASAIEAADAAVKSADISLIRIHAAMAVGGKGFVTLTGSVGSVSAAVETGARIAAEKGLLVMDQVIPSPRPELIQEFI